MNDCKATQVERQTLIQVFERLEQRCLQLREVADMTERLKEKLNRTEGQPKPEEGNKGKEPESQKNIIELFNSIANEMETQTNRIGNNTDFSMQMID